MAGKARRPMYKRERAAARKRGVLGDQAPLGCPDATDFEIAAALASIAMEAKVVIGQGGSYDRLKNEYIVVGKRLDGGTDANGAPSGKVDDFRVQGEEVALLIHVVRRAVGGRLDERRASQIR